MEAPNRILCLRLQRKKYESEPVERYISYRGSKYDLSDEDYDNLLNNIPEIWNTEKDQLTYFCLHPDKTFLCSRIKEVYNYSIKETEKKTYNFNGVTREQLNEFVSFLTDFYTKMKSDEFNKNYDNIISKLYDMSYIKYSLLEEREKSLSSCDFMFNRDYSFSSIEMEEKWKVYRQEWRDITNQDSWKSGDYINVRIPVSPEPREQIKSLAESIGSYLARMEIPKTIEEEILSEFEDNFAKIIENYSSLIVKIEIVKRIIDMRMPLGLNADELTNFPDLIEIANDIDENIKENSPPADFNVYDNYIDKMNKKIKMIDDKLNTYNIDFTVGDILEKHFNDIREKSMQLDKQEEAANLLDDIIFGEQGL